MKANEFVLLLKRRSILISFFQFFLTQHVNSNFGTFCNDWTWCSKFADFVDIFELLTALNSRMQGTEGSNSIYNFAICLLDILDDLFWLSLVFARWTVMTFMFLIIAQNLAYKCLC